LSTGEQVLALEGHTIGIKSVVYSRDGLLIATGSWDNTVRLWDATTGAHVSTLHGHGNWIGSVVFTPDSRSVVSASGDGTIRVWDIETARLLFSDDPNTSITALDSTKIDDVGWRRGRSGELLLWVPSDYQDWLHSSPCKVYISQRQVVIKAGEGGLHTGESWVECWRKDASL